MAREVGVGDAEIAQRRGNRAARVVADHERRHATPVVMDADRRRVARREQRASKAQGAPADAAKLSPTISGIAKLRATDIPSWSTSTTAEM